MLINFSNVYARTLIEIPSTDGQGESLYIPLEVVGSGDYYRAPSIMKLARGVTMLKPVIGREEFIKAMESRAEYFDTARLKDRGRTISGQAYLNKWLEYLESPLSIQAAREQFPELLHLSAYIMDLDSAHMARIIRNTGYSWLRTDDQGKHYFKADFNNDKEIVACFKIIDYLDDLLPAEPVDDSLHYYDRLFRPWSSYHNYAEAINK